MRFSECSHEKRIPSGAFLCSLANILRIVDRAAESGPAGGVLHFIQALFLLIQLSLHALHAKLLFPLPLIPTDAVGGAVRGSEADGFVEILDFPLQIRNLIFLS